MPEPDLDSVSGLDEGKSTYDNHGDLVHDVRDYTPCLDLSIPHVDTTPDAPTLDFGRTPASLVSSSATPAPAATNSPAAVPSTRTLRSSAAPSARTLSELKKLALFTKGDFPGVAHRDGFHNLVEYAYTATDTQLRSRSERDKLKVIPNTFKESMRLPEAQQWKAASEKIMESLKDLNVYTIVPRSDVQTQGYPNHI